MLPNWRVVGRSNKASDHREWKQRRIMQGLVKPLFLRFQIIWCSVYCTTNIEAQLSYIGCKQDINSLSFNTKMSWACITNMNITRRLRSGFEVK
jgi:hypothetical protein